MGLFDNELQYGDRPLAVDDQGRTASCQELDVFSGGLYEKTEAGHWRQGYVK